MFVRIGVAALALAVGMLAAAPGTAQAQKKSRDVITQEEIDKSGQKDQDLIAAIRSLRPHFFEAPRGVRSFGGGAINPVVVYVDGIRQTGLDALQTLMAKDVREVRYLDPSRSQSEYGINANGGAIVVKTLTAKDRK